MTKQFNPWIDMNINSQRRVDKSLNYDFFWMVDFDGKYGFFIESENIQENKNSSINLKGITVKKVDIGNKVKRLYMILNDNDDYEIFFTLCQDLINIANGYNDNLIIINEVEVRLKRWQRLLKNENNNKLTYERQMGLFSELIFLKNEIATEFGVDEAILSWVGPDYDKQDFLIDSAVIEVKSYKTTKGEIIYISSLNQLNTPKKNLYLVAYGLTISERGISILDIITSIDKSINDEWVRNQFKEKLFDYGYIEGINDKGKLYKFIIDKKNVYKVTDKFPKIEDKDISDKIVEVKYAIDLTKCKEFEIEIDDIFEIGGEM